MLGFFRALLQVSHITLSTKRKQYTLEAITDHVKCPAHVYTMESQYFQACCSIIKGTCFKHTLESIM